MPCLIPTELFGEVVFIGINPSRAAGIESRSLPRVAVSYSGLEGDTHGGPLRRSCSRVKRQYPKGTEIRNSRQVTVVSTEELSDVGDRMGLGEPVRPEWVGANLMLKGLLHLSQLPPSSRLVFRGGPGLVVDLENGPCRYPGEVIDRLHPGKGRLFTRSARGRRGLTAWVERPGQIALGAICRIHVPPPPRYAGWWPE